MSTASNHRKRSHRSQYLLRGFTGSRKSVVKPTLSGRKRFDLISLIRRAFTRKKEEF